ncbi:hypothetical protein D3C72_1827200 [compost metagenome]
MAQRIAETLRDDAAVGDAVHVYRRTGVKVPQLVGTDAVPRGIVVAAQHVVDRGTGFARKLVGAHDAFLAAVGLAVEAAFRVRRQFKRADQVVGGKAAVWHVGVGRAWMQAEAIAYSRAKRACAGPTSAGRLTG